MINILVVDDDLIIRQAFNKLIDWGKYDFCLKATACNGFDALEIIKKEQIDIVITDIKMPNMSGLELIENAKKEKPTTKFIILSGFDEFYLVSEAYKLGVSDYFLKMELKAEIVLESLLKLSSEIIKERDEKKKDELKARLLHDVDKYSLRKARFEKILREYVYSNHTSELYKKMEEENIIVDSKKSCLIVLHFSNYYEVEKEVYGSERELFTYGIFNVFQETLENIPNTYFFSNLPDEYIIITEGESGRNSLGNSVNKLFGMIKKNFERTFSLIVDGGFSRIKIENNSMKRIYQYALTACGYSFVVGNENIIDYKIVPIESKGTIDVNVKKYALKSLLKESDSEIIDEKIYSVKVEPSLVAVNDIAEVKSLFDIYYYEFLDYAAESDKKDEIKKYMDEYKVSLSQKGYLSELNNWLESVIDVIADKDSHINNTIIKAKNYINEHYSEQIKLSDLANQMEVSESHMSRLFKSKMNMSFTQYLMSVRIEKAKILMKTTNLKVYEISEKIGYANAEHFSRLFKQVTGKSPREYMD